MDFAGLLINFFGVVVAAALAWQANKIAKSNLVLARQQRKSSSQALSSEDRAIFRSNHRKVIDALGAIFRDGYVNDAAKNLLWQARDEARLELPADIKNYTQEIFDMMWEAYQLHYNKITGENRLPVGAAGEEACKRHSQIIRQLIEQKPSLIYKKYMRIR